LILLKQNHLLRLDERTARQTVEVGAARHTTRIPGCLITPRFEGLVDEDRDLTSQEVVHREAHGCTGEKFEPNRGRGVERVRVVLVEGECFRQTGDF